MPVLNWIGKQQVVNHDKEVSFRLLKKDTKFSEGESENLLIKGDNLEALKALMPYYAGQVKCIYIDPPYNTGNEKWVYNDRVNSPEIRKWLGETVKGEGEDLNRHDKWLCMLYPRLKLLKDLLADDGVIFVSIDENEQHHLRMIMDEIFDSTTHLATFGWAGRSGKGGTTKQVQMNHEYVECYAKNETNAKLKPVINIKGEGNYRDSKGTYKREQLRQWGQGDRRKDRPSMYFPIISPDDQEIFPKRPDGSEGRWRFGESTVKQLLQDGELDFVKDDKGNITVYRKIREGKRSIMAADSLLLDKGSASSGTIELKRIFGKKVFDTVKPTTLIKYLLDLVTYNDKDSIILDSFTGSGTTGHATLDLNKADGGNRKFILVEMESNIAEEITAERLKRVIKGYSHNGNKIEGLGGGFQFMRLGTTLFDKDGFISEDVAFKDLAQYIYFTETKTAINSRKINGLFIGEKPDTEYYLIFNGIKKNVLDKKIIKKINKNKKPKVIYADRCLLGKTILNKYRITFKQIPYEVKVY